MAESEENPWEALERELAAWQAAGCQATFWWRDDDATRADPRLDRLLKLSTKTGAPVALAVIPLGVEASLAATLEACPSASALQHGYAHVNHAPRGQGLGAWELGLHRARKAVLSDLEAGRERLKAALGARFTPVITPPWNRIDPALFTDLPGMGYRGVTAFGARPAAEPVPGLRLNHAHCDPISWKRGSAFAGDAKALGQVTRHLRARRSGEADPEEATGLLTHHADMDEASWAFTARLLEVMAAAPAARFVSVQELFPA